jgi:hypothetical protein
MMDDMFSYFLLDNLIRSGLSGTTTSLLLLISELFNVLVGPLSSFLMVLLTKSF